MGANHYITPLVSIFCVQYNNAPLVDDYWIQQSFLDNLNIEKMQQSAFRQAMLGNTQVTSTNSAQ